MFRLSLLCFFLTGAFAASSAQGVRFSEPKSLGNNVNSNYEEVMPLISPDGKTLYFSRFYDPKNTGGSQSGSDIYVSRKVDDDWTTASNNIDRLNNRYHNALIGIARNSGSIFLMNNYGGSAKNRSGVAESINTSSRFTPPVDMEIPGTNSETFHGYYMHPDGEILIVSMEGKGSLGEEDLYVSLKNSFGEWSEPTHLGATVNSDRFDISPFLSEDGSRLFFSSARPGGEGDADIYVSERLYGTWNVWTQPVNLGKTINGPYFDAYPSLGPEGTLYFASNRGGRLSDIYTSKLISGTYERLARAGASISPDDAFSVGIDTKLSEKEVEGIFGMSIPKYFRYDTVKEEIIPASRELIWFLVSELENYEGIGVTLSANDNNLYEAQVIRDFFIESGLLPEMISIRESDEEIPEALANEGYRVVKFDFLR